MGIVAEIRQLIQSGKIEAGLIKLNQWAEQHDNDIYNTSILLLSRHNQLKRNVNMGILSQSDADRSYNRIVLSILSTLDEIKE